ncbi:MAG: hypothetical protein AAFR04_13725 [Pseudomonadota bacterium]
MKGFLLGMLAMVVITLSAERVLKASVDLSAQNVFKDERAVRLTPVGQ